MFQNNNRAVVKHLAIADMKHDKLKNMISGIVITLSACLLVASSIVAYNASDELSSRYSYHGAYRAVSEQVINRLKADPNIQKVNIVENDGKIPPFSLITGLPECLKTVTIDFVIETIR